MKAFNILLSLVILMLAERTEAAHPKDKSTCHDNEKQASPLEKIVRFKESEAPHQDIRAKTSAVNDYLQKCREKDAPESERGQNMVLLQTTRRFAAMGGQQSYGQNRAEPPTRSTNSVPDGNVSNKVGEWIRPTPNS